MKHLLVYCFLLSFILPGFPSLVSAQETEQAAEGQQSVEEDIFRVIEPDLKEEESLDNVEPGPLKEGPEDFAVPVAVEQASTRAGGGVVMYSYFIGFSGFYDIILDKQSGDLIHIRLASDFTTTTGEGSNLSINRTLLNADYRIDLSFLDNSYGGAGLGYGQSSLSYSNTNTGASYSASGGGLFIIGSIGWNKYWKWLTNRHIFLDLGFNMGLYVSYKDDYDETEISDETNHRDIVNTGWEAAQQLMQLSVSFGGTF